MIILAANFQFAAANFQMPLLYWGHLSTDCIISKFDALRQNDYLHLANYEAEVW